MLVERFPFFGNRPGNWNNGTNTFLVNIPESFLVTQVNITFMCVNTAHSQCCLLTCLRGRFKCANPLGPYYDKNIVSITVAVRIFFTYESPLLMSLSISLLRFRQHLFWRALSVITVPNVMPVRFPSLWRVRKLLKDGQAGITTLKYAITITIC